jgi:hypothetical protein
MVLGLDIKDGSSFTHLVPELGWLGQSEASQMSLYVDDLGFFTI